MQAQVLKTKALVSVLSASGTVVRGSWLTQQTRTNVEVTLHPLHEKFRYLTLLETIGNINDEEQ